MPELASQGLVPWRADRHAPVAANLRPDDWLDRERLTELGDSVFVQLAPLHIDEVELIKDELSWEFVCQALLPSRSELDAGLERSSIVANLDRPNRVEAFRAARGQ
jgi:hypothetical protein